jgi:hypothetical protein
MNLNAQIEALVDQLLHGEAEDETTAILAELIETNDHALEIYLECIDSQANLKEAFESQAGLILPEPVLNQSESKPFPLWLLASLAIVAAMLYMLFGKFEPQEKPQLTLSARSHGVSVIRLQEQLKDTTDLELEFQDLISASDNGEIWISLNDNSQLYAPGGTQLRLQKNSTEKFLLIKGSISGNIKSQKNAFIFNTDDAEIRVTQALFMVHKMHNYTEISIKKGSAILTRLKDGKTTQINAGQYATSLTLKAKPLQSDAPNLFFPTLENGVRYIYKPLKKRENKLDDVDNSRVIDSGIVTQLQIIRGDIAGYVRNRHDSHSDVYHENFFIHFESLLRVKESREYTFKLKALAESRFFINDQAIHIDGDNQEDTLTVKLNRGMYAIQLDTIGLIEDDHPDFSTQVTLMDENGEFQEIPSKDLFFSNHHPLPKIFALNDADINRNLSAHLPLKGSLVDLINNEEAAPFGNPLFIKDEQFGTVLRFDGKDDYLVHFPVDQLGLTQSYTTATWIKLDGDGHYDQVLFSNSSGGQNATLVLLIRRFHPYLAHLSNDTIASETIKPGEWAHVVFRYHQGEQSIFLNGQLAVSSFNHNILSTNAPLEIGRWNSRKFKGLMSDIRIYNTALNKKDIEKIFKNTHP